ncbi:16652_t:CDS:2, partial [Dentiscutata erythropus]
METDEDDDKHVFYDEPMSATFNELCKFIPIHGRLRDQHVSAQTCQQQKLTFDLPSIYLQTWKLPDTDSSQFTSHCGQSLILPPPIPSSNIM